MLNEKNAARVQRRSSRLVSSVALVIALAGCGLSGNQAIGYEGQLEIAQQFMQTGEYDRANRILDSLATERGQSPKVFLDLGDLYLRNGDFLRAEQSFRRADRSGSSTAPRLGLARVALARNQPDVAAREFLAILNVEPSNSAAMNGLGVAHDLKGLHFDAQSYYRSAYEIDVSNLDALNNLGLSLTLGGNADSGASVLTDLARSDRGDPVTRQNLALAYGLTGQTDAAERLARVDITADQFRHVVDVVKRYRSVPR